MKFRSMPSTSCNPTVCFKIRLIKIKFCCNSIIVQPLPNVKTQFSQKEEDSGYDSIARNQPSRTHNSVHFHQGLPTARFNFEPKFEKKKMRLSSPFGPICDECVPNSNYFRIPSTIRSIFLFLPNTKNKIPCAPALISAPDAMVFPQSWVFQIMSNARSTIPS